MIWDELHLVRKEICRPENLRHADIIPVFLWRHRWIIGKAQGMHLKRNQLISISWGHPMIEDNPVRILFRNEKRIISSCRDKDRLLRLRRKIFPCIRDPRDIISEILKCPMKCEMNPAMRMCAIRISPDTDCMVFEFLHTFFQKN